MVLSLWSKNVRVVYLVFCTFNCTYLLIRYDALMILKRFISDAFIKKLHSSHLIIELWTVLTRFPGPSKGTGVPLPFERASSKRKTRGGRTGCWRRDRLVGFRHGWRHWRAVTWYRLSRHDRRATVITSDDEFCQSRICDRSRKRVAIFAPRSVEHLKWPQKTGSIR